MDNGLHGFPGPEALRVAAATITGLSGALVGCRLVGATASGPPTHGTYQALDVCPDGTGTIWICTAPGSPGTWTRVSNPMTTQGDIIVGGTSGTPTRLGIGSTGQLLTVTAGVPAWVFPGVKTVTTAYTVLASDRVVLVDAASAAVTVTLPLASGAGSIVTVKKIDSSANTVTIAATSPDTIDGAATQVLSTQYAHDTLAPLPAGNWYLI